MVTAKPSYQLLICPHTTPMPVSLFWHGAVGRKCYRCYLYLYLTMLSECAAGCAMKRWALTEATLSERKPLKQMGLWESDRACDWGTSVLSDSEFHPSACKARRDVTSPVRKGSGGQTSPESMALILSPSSSLLSKLVDRKNSWERILKL